MLRTARQTKTLCRSCPLARAAHLIGDTCSLLIIRDLLEKPRRFGELQASLQGVSTRTLANKLRFLAEHGFLTRTAKDPRPYTLTPKGRALRPTVRAMRAYGTKYLTQTR